MSKKIFLLQPKKKKKKNESIKINFTISNFGPFQMNLTLVRFLEKYQNSSTIAKKLPINT